MLTPPQPVHLKGPLSPTRNLLYLIHQTAGSAPQGLGFRGYFWAESKHKMPIFKECGYHRASWGLVSPRLRLASALVLSGGKREKVLESVYCRRCE